MNSHCKSCLRAHSKKLLVGVIALVDLALAICQSRYIAALPVDEERKVWMLSIVLGRGVLTWLMFGIAVTAIGRIVRCHTEGGDLHG